MEDSHGLNIMKDNHVSLSIGSAVLFSIVLLSLTFHIKVV